MAKIQKIDQANFKQFFSEKAGEIEVPKPEIFFKDAILEIQKNALGPYFWYVADLQTMSIPLLGGTISQIGNLNLSSLLGKYPDLLFEQVHHEDLHCMFAYTTYWLEFYAKLNPNERDDYRAVFYTRLKNGDDYKLYMVQFPAQLLLNNLKYIYGLILLTDISQINTNQSAILSIINLKTSYNEIISCNDIEGLSVNRQDKNLLSPREIAILRKIAQGSTSKQIAHDLGISVNTVHNHRFNMRFKTNTQSSAELVSYALKIGLL
jgi:DNA-binding CsgD family transcriptional regulator